MMRLNNAYNRNDFLQFLEENFLTDFMKDIRPTSTQGLSSIQIAYSLGRSEHLDLQVFEFSFEGSSNKRVALTKDAFQVMRSHAIFQALAIFHSPSSNDWRLSLMTATPERTEKGKVALLYSNPKRLSFFLGPNAKTKTPIQLLIKRDR
jgi:adenine-specific DNA-methyltransferase